MADPDSQASRAEQRAFAVAKLKRAASLPRMKDGRRPPMHAEAVSDGEKVKEEAPMPSSNGEATESTEQQNSTQDPQSQESPPQAETTNGEARKNEYESPPPETQGTEAEIEADAETEDRSFSPGPTKSRRRRSRSRSRNSKDFKGKNRVQTPVVAGDSSDEAPPIPISPIAIPTLPALFSPIPSHFAAYQAPRLLAASPDPSLFYPGTSPSTPMPYPTPLPTLEDIQKGLMRSNSAGSAAASRRLALAKLTGGTETYDPSPSPTPPLPKLSRNNTVAGGERFAARQLMLGRLAGRVAKETDTEQQISGEERGTPSPNPNKRRRRRSRRGSAAVHPGVSDSDPVSSSNTPLPPTPLPIPIDTYNDLRTESTTPNQASSSRNQSSEHIPGYFASHSRTDIELHETRRRSVVIEDDEEEDVRYVPLSKSPAMTNTPPPPQSHVASHISAVHLSGLRGLHTPSPAAQSVDSAPTTNGGSTVPLYYGRGSPTRLDKFPSSPFTTPLKEKPLSDEDEEQVLYPADPHRPRTPRVPTLDAYDREISWVASLVPEIRMPVDDDEEEEEEDHELGAEIIVQDEAHHDQEYEEAPVSPSSANGFPQAEIYDDVSPRISTSTKSIIIESEASADVHPIHISVSKPQFPTTQTSQLASYHQPNGDRSPVNGEYTDWEDPVLNRESSSKRGGEASSPSTWEKVKNTFSRSTSSNGRRSRTNSILNRERNSSVSRESGASLTSGKGEQDFSGFPQPVAPQLMQSPSASASILSLSPHAPFRGNPSPIPPASSADMAKYQNDKLFPFPGMRKLEEQRNRDRARVFPSASASTPDVSMLASGEEIQTPVSATSFTNPHTPDGMRERKLSHQASDPRLNFRYAQDMPVSPVKQGYIDLVPLNASTSSSSSKSKLPLPMTFTDVKHWLSKNKGKKSQTNTPSTSAPPVALSPSFDSQHSSGSHKKASLSDLLRSKDVDLNSDWEDNRTPTNGKVIPIQEAAATSPTAADPRSAGRETPAPAPNAASATDTERTPKAKKIIPLNIVSSSDSRYQVEEHPIPESAKPGRYLSPTPDPASSMSDFPPQSTSESSSTTSSQYSLTPTPQALALLERLDETLNRGIAPIDEHPRKLLLSSPVLQVVNPNTVKDRFLFLFTDILVVAKPILQDQNGSMMDSSMFSPTDRKYLVKSVVRFKDLRFSQDRTDTHPKSSTPSSSITRSPLLRAFVAQFAKDPDQAIATLFFKSDVPDDSTLVGQLLFKCLDVALNIDRSQLGEYLARRTSKTALKAYLDSFGFAGLKIDVALRIFLHTIHIPRSLNNNNSSPLDYLMDSFASRWYDANTNVAYDKDMAIRLVRAIVQLNELLHGTIADHVGPTGPIMRDITSKDFYDAFRRYDPRRSVSDDLLDDIYRSIRQERLSQARAHPPLSPDITVTFKRPLPSRLTYKIQSDPIIIRLPQPDPHLTLQLYGQDLIFEPPVLNFAKSPEASFRVTGTSLGSKTLVILRSGPNAIKYAGLPYTYTLPIERAFMRNTFQIAFLNHHKAKRRYMFSVDDHLLRHQWVQSIRQQIEKSATLPTIPPENSLLGAADFYRAADDVAFKVLQETLTGTGLSGNGSGVKMQPVQGSGYPSASALQKDSAANHRRSKSRSKLYPRHGGRLEFDLNGSHSHRYNSSRESNDTDVDDGMGGPYDQSGKLEGRVWSGRELELQCQQNSLIPGVLSYLQVGTGPS